MEDSEERQPHDVIASDTDNATQIHPKDASPDKQRKFRKFRDYNTGKWNGPRRENTQSFNRQDDLHRFDSISSSAELTQYQKSRGRKILDDFDCHHFGQSIDHIIFGICVVVANDDVNGGTRYWPTPNRSDEPPLYEVAESLGLGWREQMSAIEKVNKRIDL